MVIIISLIIDDVASMPYSVQYINLNVETFNQLYFYMIVSILFCFPWLVSFLYVILDIAYC